MARTGVVTAAAVIVVIITLGIGFGIGYFFYDAHSESSSGDVRVTQTKPPNIIFILTDDMGYNDVSWNNPEVIMPNLDELARNGLILDQNYMTTACTPSRGALLTGMYPFHIGFQHHAITHAAPECIPLDMTMLPQKLKELGYATHMAGKWHLGFCNWNCTPTYRGFDTFQGFYQAFGDYYEHDVWGGFDWRDGVEVDNSSIGNYATDLITDRGIEVLENHNFEDPMFLYLAYSAIHAPVAAPQAFIDMYPQYASLPYRQLTLAVATAMDHSIGRLLDVLRERDLMDDTIIFFSSDNGGQRGTGSNIPLRGAKHSIYEGGTRVPAFVYGRGVARPGQISNGLIHGADWFSTIVSLAGGSTEDLGVDGVDQSDLLFGNGVSSRTEMVYNINDDEPQRIGARGIRVGDYKLLVGFPGMFDGWESDGSLAFTHVANILGNANYTPPDTNYRGPYNVPDEVVQDYIEFVRDHVQLYNIRTDPSERNDLASELPDIVADLRARLDEHATTVLPVDPALFEQVPAGDPSNFGGNWSPGWC